MKLIRLFVGFVVASLVIGIGSAFNGQSTVSQIEETPEISTEVVEKVESKTEENSLEETENVEKANDEKKNNSNSFSESKKTTSKTETSNNISTTNQEKTVVQNDKSETNQNTNSQVKQEEKQEQVVQNSNANASNNTTPKYDADSKQDCYNLGNRITNNELNYILDWNEQHPDDLKQPIIDNPSCHEVFVNGVSKWYLHFTTSNGVDMDEYLKNMYK